MKKCALFLVFAMLLGVFQAPLAAVYAAEAPEETLSQVLDEVAPDAEETEWIQTEDTLSSGLPEEAPLPEDAEEDASAEGEALSPVLPEPPEEADRLSAAPSRAGSDDSDMELLFEDDFSSDTGAWSPNSETWTIANGVYTQSSTSSGYLTFAGESDWTDYEIEVKVTPLTTTNGISFMINGRASDANNRYYASYNNGSLTLSRRWNSTSAKNMITKPYTMALNQQYTIKLVFVGQRISLYVDGTLELEYTDTDNAYSQGKIGLGTNKTSAQFDDVIVRGFPAPSETLTLDTPADYQVIQRDPAAKNGVVSLSGKVDHGTSAAVKVRVMDYAAGADESPVVDWTTVSENAQGEWSGEITVPQGGWYKLEVQAVESDGSVLETLRSDRRFGVGINILCIGQSNMVGQGKGTATVADDRAANCRYNIWHHLQDPYDGAGNSLVPAMANKLVETLDLPVGIIPAAYSGSGLHARNVNHKENWYWIYLNEADHADPGTLYGRAITRAKAAGGVELVVWNQGETDGALEVPQDVYAEDMRTLLARLRSDLENETLPLFLCQIGTHDNNISSEAPYSGIRNAQQELDDGENFFLAATEMEFERQDTAHYTTPGLNEIGRRVANSILYYYGQSDYYRGPYIESADFADTTRAVVDVTIVHRGGSDISTTGDITGFSVLNNGTPVEVLTAQRQSPTVIRLTLAKPITGSGILRYLYGLNPAHTNVAKDNTEMQLPLENTTTDVPIGADQPSLWGLLDSSMETNYSTDWNIVRGKGLSTGTVTQQSGFVNFLKSDEEPTVEGNPGPYVWLVPKNAPSLPSNQTFTTEVTLRMAGETTSPKLSEISIRMGEGSNDTNGKLYPIYLKYGADGAGLISVNPDGSDGYALDTTVWHNYGMVIDPTAQTYDIYVDGVKAVTGAEARTYKGGNLFRIGMDSTARGNMDIRSARAGAGNLSDFLSEAENPWPDEGGNKPPQGWDILDHEMFPDWKSDSFRSSSKAGVGVITQKEDCVNILKPETSALGTRDLYHWLISPASLSLPRAGFTMETTVRAAAPIEGEANEIAVRMGNDANDTNGKIASLFLGYGEKGYLSANTIGGGLYCVELNTTEWHKLTVVVFLNDGSFYYDVYVDGQLAFDSVPFQTYKGGDLIRFGSDNGGRCNLDVKDVRVGTGTILPDGASPAKITGVTLSESEQKETEAKTVTVTVTGKDFEDGAPVSLVLLSKDYSLTNITAQGVFSNNTAEIPLTIPAGLKVSSYYVQATANGRKAVSGIYNVTSNRPAPVFPEFTPVGYTIEMEDYIYNPTQEFNFPCVVDTKDHPVSNDLGDYRYYLFYAPHDAPAGCCVAASNSLDGPWVEYASNPVVSKVWPKEDGSGENYYSVSHVSSPHVMWNEQHGKWFMYFHGENPTTRYATSDDLIHWTYGDVCVTANQFSPTGSGFSEASYARVYEHEVPGLGNRYIMLLMVTGSGNGMHRNIYWAHSTDAIHWTPVTQSLLNPDMDPQYMNNFSGPSFMEWGGRYYVICHASSGEIYAFEVGEGLDEMIPWGMVYESRGNRYESTGDDESEWPDYGRAGAPCFIQDDEGIWHMFYEGGRRLHANIVHAVGSPVEIPVEPLTITASQSALTGGGTVTLTVAGVPDGQSASVSCDNENYTPVFEDGVWKVTLPNSTASYVFTASVGERTASCTVTVTGTTSDGSSGGSTTQKPAPKPEPPVPADNVAVSGGGEVSKSVNKDGTVTYTFKPEAEKQVLHVRVNGLVVEAAETLTAEESDRVVVVFGNSDASLLDSFSDAGALPSYAVDAVEYVVSAQLFHGTGDGRFDPNGNMDRAMFAAVLARLYGADTAGITSSFSDVGSGAWYEGPVAWAADMGFVHGVAPNQFAPTQAITRQELIVMVYRFAQKVGADVSARADLSVYRDGGQIADWAEEATAWAVGAGLIKGRLDGIAPDAAITRAEAAVILQRMAEVLEKKTV